MGSHITEHGQANQLKPIKDMKKLVFILALALAFASCEKVQDDVTVQSQELLKKKPTGNNGNGNGNNNTMQLLAINGDDTLVMSPFSPLNLAVGDSLLLTITPDLECSWANSNMTAADFYVLDWSNTPFDFYGNECWLIGLESEAPDNWGLVTAGFTFADGTRINTTNYYFVTP